MLKFNILKPQHENEGCHRGRLWKFQPPGVLQNASQSKYIIQQVFSHLSNAEIASGIQSHDLRVNWPINAKTKGLDRGQEVKVHIKLPQQQSFSKQHSPCFHIFEKNKTSQTLWNILNILSKQFSAPIHSFHAFKAENKHRHSIGGIIYSRD